VRFWPMQPPFSAVYMKASRERVSLRIGRGHDQT
jgi:hypothetical protein